MRRDNLEHIVNVAVNQTLARTIITAGTHAVERASRCISSAAKCSRDSPSR